MPALDYSRVAAVYDDYCPFDRDIEFFRSRLLANGGKVLELMAGTGRLSVPLAETGVDLTCLDSSAAMLGVLRRKLGEGQLRAAVVCADVRAIPFQARFESVVLPFNGLCELVTAEDRQQAMQAVAGALAGSGRFVCTTHNPSIRRRTLDGTWQEVGEFARQAGGVARVALKGRVDPATRIVEGQQRIELVEESGRTSEILVPLRFSLVSAPELITLAEECGLQLVSLCGDYDGSTYDEAVSPFVVATFGKST